MTIQDDLTAASVDVDKEVGRPTRVIVDGWDLNQWDAERGVAWRFRSITGWRAGTPVRVRQVPRENAHGSYAQRGYRDGRMITIRGDIIGHEPAQVGAALDRLSALLADGGFGQFRFDDGRGDDKTATVQLFALDDGGWNNTPICSYQMQLWSPDPYRYGHVSTGSTTFPSIPDGVGLVFPLFAPDGVLDFGATADISQGLVTLENPGTAPATPTFEITGPTPASGFVIIDTATGARIEFLSVVPDGAVLRIDAADGSALINEVADRSGDLIVDTWPSVAPGTSATFSFQPLAESSDATLTASVTATYY
ncbi:phage distal tail protein [uncultured Aeromicrobium sp.]|uniref:phage distal tail protein n=1 Tax=uncultured Aeromicrobium sp. TaxID=337820 RepID=UPI0025F6BB6E|nr:phage tail domain-containing protein [uncultured Aeromicrobium sp.]